MWISAEILPPVNKEVLCRYSYCGGESVILCNIDEAEVWHENDVPIGSDTIVEWADDPLLVREFKKAQEVGMLMYQLLETVDQFDYQHITQKELLYIVNTVVNVLIKYIEIATSQNTEED